MLPFEHKHHYQSYDVMNVDSAGTAQEVSEHILFLIQTYISCITQHDASRIFAQSRETLSQLRNYG